MTKKGHLLKAQHAEPPVLPELEDLVAATAAAQVSRSAAKRGIAGRRGGHLAVLGLACLALSGTALAASGGWQSLIGNEANDGPPELSYKPVPGLLRETLAVLRRPQDARDRSPQVRAVLHKISSYHVDGVRPESIRFLRSGAGDQAAILFSAEESDEPWTSGPLACVVTPVLTEGSTEGCFDVWQIRRREAVSYYGGPGRTVASGLAPDGVRYAIARFTDGTKVRIPVVNNYFFVAGGSMENLTGRKQPPAVAEVTLPKRREPRTREAPDSGSVRRGPT